MKIYIASKFSSRNRLIPYRDAIEAMGFEVTSTWMLDDPEPSANFDSLGDNLEESQSMATRDINQVGNCDIFIICTEDPSDTGGREVELGMAIVTNKTIFRIGPIRNVFHTHPLIIEKTWQELLNNLANSLNNYGDYTNEK